jgi:hypothetical protein
LSLLFLFVIPNGNLLFQIYEKNHPPIPCAKLPQNRAQYKDEHQSQATKKVEALNISCTPAS